MLEGLALGLSEALSWNHLLVILLSTIVGLLVGIIPGLGPVTAMALLILQMPNHYLPIFQR